MTDAQRCIAHREDGRICLEPATIEDYQCGGWVCPTHTPHPVREKLLQGALSLDLQHPPMITIGMGSGEHCPVCEKPISPKEPKILLYDHMGRNRSVGFHEPCERIYQRERAIVQRSRSQGT